MRVYCCGDIVGYGASPNEVVRVLREIGATCVLGNHDRAALSGDVGDFNPRAGMAAIWTSQHLTEESRAFLGLSAPGGHDRAVGEEGLHGARVAGRPDVGVRTPLDAHRPLRLLLAEGAGRRDRARAHAPRLSMEERHGGGLVFNPGSVGQPRTGDTRASFAILSAEAGGRSRWRRGRSSTTLRGRRRRYSSQAFRRRLRPSSFPASRPRETSMYIGLPVQLVLLPLVLAGVCSGDDLDLLHADEEGQVLLRGARAWRPSPRRARPPSPCEHRRGRIAPLLPQGLEPPGDVPLDALCHQLVVPDLLDGDYGLPPRGRLPVSRPPEVELHRGDGDVHLLPLCGGELDGRAAPVGRPRRRPPRGP